MLTIELEQAMKEPADLEGVILNQAMVKRTTGHEEERSVGIVVRFDDSKFPLNLDRLIVQLTTVVKSVGDHDDSGTVSVHNLYVPATHKFQKHITELAEIQKLWLWTGNSEEGFPFGRLLDLFFELITLGCLDPLKEE